MPAPTLNGACFLAPDADNPHFAAASGGIVAPRYRRLPRGTRLWRFGHTVDEAGNNVPRTRNYGSPWWIGEEAFASFLAGPPPSARAGFLTDPGDQPPAPGFDSVGFNTMVRLRLAVVRRFGKADRIIAAVLTEDLGCFSGRGKPILEDATGNLRAVEVEGIIALVPDALITQLYIPGLRSDPAGSASSALRVLKDRPAHEFFLY